MSTDATPSWSGYIFQGEVAFCRAVETINRIAKPIPDNYCLKLEEDEDFSIQTDEIEVFQVKAYLSPDANKVSKYKSVIEELINKYYYYKWVVVDPNDGRKRNHIYHIGARRKPIKCTLLTDNIIIDYQPDLSNLHVRYQAATNFQCEQGVYTIANINQKMKDAIKVFCSNPAITDEDIATKVSHCCLNIARIVKERHATKRKEKIYFRDIIQWINAPLAFSEELCWYEISKLFLKFLSQDLNVYNLTQPSELAEYIKIQAAIEELEKLPYDDLVLLIKYYTTPHKILDKTNLRQSFGSFLESSAVKSVVLKAVREINQSPRYKSLQYIKTNQDGESQCYQLLNHNSEFDDTPPQQAIFQQHCEEFYKHPNSIEVDVFVTRHLSITKDQIKDRLTDILDPLVTEADLKKNLFSFLTIQEALKDINT